MGLILLGWKPVEWLVGIAGDVDFIVSNWAAAEQFMNSPWAVVASVLLGFFLIAQAIRSTPEKETESLSKYLSGRLKTKIKNEFKNKTYYNSPIPMDGNAYLNCKFYNCKYIYNGGAGKLEGCEISGTFMIETEDPAIKNFINTMNFLGFFSVPIATDDGIKLPDDTYKSVFLKNNIVQGVNDKAGIPQAWVVKSDEELVRIVKGGKSGVIVGAEQIKFEAAPYPNIRQHRAS